MCIRDSSWNCRFGSQRRFNFESSKIRQDNPVREPTGVQDVHGVSGVELGPAIVKAWTRKHARRTVLAILIPAHLPMIPIRVAITQDTTHVRANRRHDALPRPQTLMTIAQFYDFAFERVICVAKVKVKISSRNRSGW